MKYISKLDLFGEPVKIHIQNKEKIKTNLGGFLAILMVLALMISSWLIGKDIIEKTKPNSYFQTQNEYPYPNITLSSMNFPFTLILTDFLGKIIPNEEQYF